MSSSHYFFPSSILSSFFFNFSETSSSCLFSLSFSVNNFSFFLNWDELFSFIFLLVATLLALLLSFFISFYFFRLEITSFDCSDSFECSVLFLWELSLIFFKTLLTAVRLFVSYSEFSSWIKFVFKILLLPSLEYSTSLGWSYPLF